MRKSRDEYFLGMAEYVAGQSTCLRRAVGCVLVDERGHVLSTGYNGVAAGMPHCNKPHPSYDSDINVIKAVQVDGIFYKNACPGAKAPSGTNLDGCHALHDVWNALIQCRDAFSIYACYSGCSPCITCTKMLMNTSCKRIVFREPYAHDEPARDLWQRLVDGPGINQRTLRTWEHQPCQT